MTETTQLPPNQLPDVNTIGFDAPLRWLAGGWRDFWAAPVPCLAYGLCLAGLSAAFAWALYATGALTWVAVLAGGFMLVAPVLAMGMYETGRLLEQGKRPGLSDIFFVKSAFRRDLFFLGLALFLVYSLWVEMALIVYTLSSNQVHETPQAFLTFITSDPAGIRMVLVGTLIGGMFALLAFTLVVVSAPMMLNEQSDVFSATVTSFRSVTRNVLPMLLWAFLIATVTLLGIATGFVGLIIGFPVIGLASWRAYRELVAHPPRA